MVMKSERRADVQSGRIRGAYGNAPLQGIPHSARELREIDFSAARSDPGERTGPSCSAESSQGQPADSLHLRPQLLDGDGDGVGVDDLAVANGTGGERDLIRFLLSFPLYGGEG